MRNKSLFWWRRRESNPRLYIDFIGEFSTPFRNYLILRLPHFYRKKTGSRTAVLVALCLLLAACSPTAARIDGFNAQARAFEMLQSEPFEPFVAEIKVRVRIIPQDTHGGLYFHPEGLIVVQGKMIGDKIVTCPAIVGHEFQHALQWQDGRFYDPDRAEEYGY
jgi:hypothetical protein